MHGEGSSCSVKAAMPLCVMVLKLRQTGLGQTIGQGVSRMLHLSQVQSARVRVAAAPKGGSQQRRTLGFHGLPLPAMPVPLHAPLAGHQQAAAVAVDPVFTSILLM